MFNTIKKLIQYPRLTQAYPKKPLDTTLFLSKPEIDASRCNRCGECVSRCPASAIVLEQATASIGINYDECIFCALCGDVCPENAVKVTGNFELAGKERAALRHNTLVLEDAAVPPMDLEALCEQLQAKAKKVLGRSLQIREVDAGSCNGCDYEINALNNPVNDIERLGIHFVASPRHADMLLVTGTGSRNMQLALAKTYNATPDPKLVVAVGACACSGGIFRHAYAANCGIDTIVPVDVYVPGCPPRPQAIIYGILKALDRLK